MDGRTRTRVELVSGEAILETNSGKSNMNRRDSILSGNLSAIWPIHTAGNVFWALGLRSKLRVEIW